MPVGRSAHSIDLARRGRTELVLERPADLVGHNLEERLAIDGLVVFEGGDRLLLPVSLEARSLQGGQVNDELTSDIAHLEGHARCLSHEMLSERAISDLAKSLPMARSGRI